jgi:hypothetical protein
LECVSIEDDDRADDKVSDLDLTRGGNDCFNDNDDDGRDNDSCADDMTYSDMQEEDDGCGDDRDDLEQDEQNVSRARRYLFRLTTFHLKYDKNDDLTAGSSRRVRALFAWLISHQPAVLFSQNKPATSNQPAVPFSQNKPAPAISHQPTEQAVDTTATGCQGARSNCTVSAVA